MDEEAFARAWLRGQNTTARPSHVHARGRERGRGQGGPKVQGNGAALADPRAGGYAAGRGRRGAATPRSFRGGHGGYGYGSPGGRRGGYQNGSQKTRRGTHESGRNNGAGDQEREIGLQYLAKLAGESGISIMENLANESTLLLFEKLTREKQMKGEWMRHLVTILAKLCEVEYKPIIIRLFGTICHKQFLDQLLLHITHLLSDNNSCKETGDFLKELCTLCNAILELTPNLACDNLDIILKRAYQDLEDMPHFEGCEDIRKKFKSLRMKLMQETDRIETIETVQSNKTSCAQAAPTTDFRKLSHLPGVEDIVVESLVKPYLRPNKINLKVHGPYKDVNDYLDVQFRLTREDCFRPLREGILDFRKALVERKKTNSKKPYRNQNIRIYERVRIRKLQVEDEKIGMVLCFDPSGKFTSKIQWEYSKRLMTGSLLVLSVDEEFSSIILAIVSQRDEKDLKAGEVTVELCEGTVRKGLLHQQFLMVESQVFFGAYCPVLKALKNFDEDSFPLADYIVYASNVQQLPDYQVRARALNPKTSFRLVRKTGKTQKDKIELLPLRGDRQLSKLLGNLRLSSPRKNDLINVNIEKASTWPSHKELGLDDSQYRALCGALRNKVMLIQGPPGTGKTFIGMRIAACLLENEELWRRSEDPRPMLVVCYTNHALDQFLTGLKSVTDSIVRVGGGSKEPILEENNIRHLRRYGRNCVPRGYQGIVERERLKFAALKNLRDRILDCSKFLRDRLVSLDTLCSYGIVSDWYLHYLTDVDIFMWLCGYGQKMRLPQWAETLFKRHAIIDPNEPVFNHLQFPTEGMPIVEVSMTFIPSNIMEARDVLEKNNESPEMLDLFLRNLNSIAYYEGYTEIQHHPHPAGLWRLNIEQRWQLYREWRDALATILMENFETLVDEIEVKLTDLAEQLATWRMVGDRHIMAAHTIVGMTTSYAAAHQQNLKALKPRIVIVEEAAEIFESHVVVSLAGDVEHLIMIGDHQQLRPNPSVHELGVKYHLNVSLFERLINNGMNYVTLSTQHRMRPEVAKLISPTIYPDLKNHPSVAEFPAVRGVAKNVFFVDHQHPEEMIQDLQSYRNYHEAEFLSSLVKYLLLQGYDADKITVLSTYKGQQHVFTKLSDRYDHLKNVRITVVDNFQGEESDIILLSLVRSNAQDVVGFLKTENRVCVALSRARHGLYIIGNMKNLMAADTVWRKVEKVLRRQDAIGPALRLQCERHGVITPVSKAEDFLSCKLGGCQQQCLTALPCGHHCKLQCHIVDMEHKNARCKEKCSRPACALQHPCPQLCFESCPPCLVPKEEKLPCGHSAVMACHVDPADYKCKVDVNSRTLPACGHERNVRCYQVAVLDTLTCNVSCAVPMRCGHLCGSFCHAADKEKHSLVECKEPCEKNNVGCTADPPHKCPLNCYKSCEPCGILVDRTLACGHVLQMPCHLNFIRPCSRPCDKTLPCGHACTGVCSQPCGPCMQLVPKTVPGCGHIQRMNCSQSPDSFRGSCQRPCERLLSCGHRCHLQCGQDCATGRSDEMGWKRGRDHFLGCQMPCERSLPCGHQCGMLCGQDCATGYCHELVPYARTPACGHPVSVPCYRQNDYEPNSPELLALCTHPCSTLLKPCDHQCGGSCGACLQGRLHQPCKSKCERRLLCGHLCTEMCFKACPPCALPCERPCSHWPCSRLCGQPCVRCKKQCARRCEHGRCRKLCGDQCSFECSEPCRKKVEACGHDCIGLCGDPCICRECNEEEVAGSMAEGQEIRFVMLPDCKHILESTSLDKWMSLENSEDGAPSEIKSKVCPKCSTRITSCTRYSNSLKEIALDISAVEAQFHNTERIQSHLVKLNEILPRFPPGYWAANRLLSCIVRLRESVGNTRKPKGRDSGRLAVLKNTVEAKNLVQKALLLRSLGQIVNSAVDLEKRSRINPDGMKELRLAVERLSSTLSERDLVCLTDQEASDFGVERVRLQRLVELLRVENGPEFPKLNQDDKAKHEEVARILRGVSLYLLEHDTEVQAKLDALAAAATCGELHREEATSVLAATKLGAGHWFRCPNGHLNCIAERGGAGLEAACPVEGCKARVKGTVLQL